jgi:hypothetical protein
MSDARSDSAASGAACGVPPVCAKAGAAIVAATAALVSKNFLVVMTDPLLAV